jgi:DNA-binding transcriptional regulator YiaG
MSKSKQPENNSSNAAGFAANDNKTRERFEQALTNLDEKLKPWTDAIRDSEQLSEEDFAIRINTRD